MTSSGDRRWTGGAGYGLTWTPVNSPLLIQPSPSWPRVAVERGAAAEGPVEDRLGAEEAALRLPYGGRALLRREPLSARLEVGPISDDDLVRRHLAPVAAVLGAWCGRVAI